MSEGLALAELFPAERPFPDAARGQRWMLGKADAAKLEHLRLHLGMFVPLVMDDLRRGGFPLEHHIARVSGYAQEIAEFGDQLLFRGKRSGELMAKLTDGVAVMAFVDGGITLFGLHFEATYPDEEPTRG